VYEEIKVSNLMQFFSSVNGLTNTGPQK